MPLLPLAAGCASESAVPDQPWGDEETLRGAYNRVASIHSQQNAGSLLVAIEGGVGYAAPLPAGAAGVAGSVRPQRQQPGQQQGGAATLPRHQAWTLEWQHQRHREQQQQQQGQQRGGSSSCPELECFAWVVVQAPCGATSHARSASFPLPPAVSELMLTHGLELGDADDAVFGRWGGARRGCWRGRAGQRAGGQGRSPRVTTRPSPACAAAPARRSKSGSGSGTIGQLTRGLVSRQLYYEHAVLMALVPVMAPQHFPAFDLSRLPALPPAGGGE